MRRRAGSSRIATAETSAATSAEASGPASPATWPPAWPGASPRGRECIPGAMTFILTPIPVDQDPLYILLSIPIVFRRDPDEHRQARARDHRTERREGGQPAPACRPRPRKGQPAGSRARRARPPARSGPRPLVAAPGRHPSPGRDGVHRDADTEGVRPHDLPQRRALRRAGAGQEHPGAVAVRAPHAAVHRGRPRRLPARRAHPRPVQAGPRGRAVRPRPPGPGAAHRSSGELAAGAPRTQGSRCGDRGRTHVHVHAWGPGQRFEDHHVRRPRCAARGRALAPGVLCAHKESLMASAQTFVIVGASLAGAKAAETLRTEGFDGRVVLIGEETERPYERPMLSKEYLRGDKPAAKLYVHDEGYYADNDIELLTGTHVASFDPAAHEVNLQDGSRMPYSRLLLSTGATPRRLPLPGTDLPGVRYLRAMGESDALRA